MVHENVWCTSRSGARVGVVHEIAARVRVVHESTGRCTSSARDYGVVNEYGVVHENE